MGTENWYCNVEYWPLILLSPRDSFIDAKKQIVLLSMYLQQYLGQVHKKIWGHVEKSKMECMLNLAVKVLVQVRDKFFFPELSTWSSSTYFPLLGWHCCICIFCSCKINSKFSLAVYKARGMAFTCPASLRMSRGSFSKSTQVSLLQPKIFSFRFSIFVFQMLHHSPII